MDTYYVHTVKDNKGNYEVHKSTCKRLPEPANKEKLGDYKTCKEAVVAAEEKGYKPADGCYYCSPECDNG